MPAQSLYVHAVGMACPLGLTALAACAAMRAGIERKQELPYRTDVGHPIIGSFLPSIGGADITGNGQARWMSLLILALKDLFRCSRSVPAPNQPLLLALPPEASQLRPWIVERLNAELSLGLTPQAVHIVTEGAYGGYRAMATARSLLLQGTAERIVVCAADSLIGARRLLDLDRARRLLTQDNPDGVIPGEAAAAVLLELRHAGAQALIRGIGLGQEPGLLGNDIPLRGEGIVAATRQALREAELAMHDMDVRASDAAGESYAFKEQILVVTRLLRQNKDAFPLWLAALTLGDTGAAAGLCNLNLILHAYRRQYFPGRLAIAYAASEQGQRAAIIVDKLRG